MNMPMYGNAGLLGLNFEKELPKLFFENGTKPHKTVFLWGLGIIMTILKVMMFDV